MEISMGMTAEQQQQQQQTMRASPALIALNNMLILSTVELQQLIQRELEENPALEMTEQEEETICPRCGRSLSGVTCIYCLQEDLRTAEADREDYASAPSDEEFDPLMRIAAPPSLGETLIRDLRASLPQEDHFIAEFLIGCLDDHGYLDGSVADAAASLGIDAARVEQVLLKLQDVGPVGVGARNVPECLLLQLRRLEQEGVTHPLVETIICHHWKDLGEHRYGAIAQALGVDYAQVVEARDFIRRYLRPYPLQRLDDDGSPSETAYVTPDVIIREVSGKLEAEVIESNRYYLRLNPLYQELSRRASKGLEEVSPEEKEHLTQFVSRAQLFLTNLRQRRETIRRTAEYLIQRQEEFLRFGVRHLKPLTRAEVAEAIGVHESTVSRATANKYVQLPSREIIPFSHFFTASLSVKDVLEELVSNEPHPLTDQELVELLRERGFDVARRTVAKYRNQLGILPSTLR
ncbi:MAG: RNA polymerase sigma-54 factor [Herpetosiphonaceae bacterium]|nr:MAG: RNA polymerase sigma-54 factor [Herpetosiphonaceae bacterium]